jgi:hypothetical protein
MKFSPQYSPKSKSKYKYILPTLQEDASRSITVKYMLLSETNQPFRARNTTESLQIIQIFQSSQFNC